MKFYKIDNFWWELEGNKLYNIVGGHQLTEWYNIKDEDIVEVDDWEYLDWIGTDIHNDNLKTGWIDRDGKFYGCDYNWHSQQAKFIHHKSQRELELLGWIKVYKSSMFSSNNKNRLGFMIISNRINDLQKNALFKLDFTDEEIEVGG